ncbi:glycosyltransferase family 2 protein [Ectobacillus ponti]|uniref:Beta-monoglucosyldiacylglycerol synthase n=1 Tax=Ectobacillus ponti TaxID=2961894 RepID=A0AA41XAC7_9BACI|nr:glycosyltransferase family 2 protein [Ectobacillus ponti]MCP8970083.1 glycosyltransferase family 2 protein [Ectobacillus ponti]
MAEVLYLSSFYIIWFILLYYIFLMQGGFLHALQFRRLEKEWNFITKRVVPRVSVLIPAHNEEVVIRQTLTAMARLRYPKTELEVIVINDNSSDRTGAICEEFAAQYTFIRCITTKPPFAGRGKSSALNQGLAAATGEIIAIYDADNEPEPDAVYKLAMALVHDEKAGAVVGKFRVINATRNLLTRFINIETICFQWMAQAGRWYWLKLCTIPGTNFAIRRSVLEQLGGWDVDALSEDTELSLRVYDLGYHIRFYPGAVTWEQEPENWKVWWKQRTRWARGNLYVLLKYLANFRSLRVKRLYFDIVYLYFTYIVFLAGILISHGIFLYGLLFGLQLPAVRITFWFMVLAYLLFVVEAALTITIEQKQLTLKNILTILIMYFTYSQVWIGLVVYALYLEIKRVLFKQEVRWYKTSRFQQPKDM